MAIPWRHQPSPWPAAAWAAGRWNRLLTHALCLAVNQNRKYNVFLGSFEYLLFFSDELLYIYIRLVWFQCKVTILFTVFKLNPAPLHPHRGQLQQQSTACTYSNSCPLALKKGMWSKQTKWTTSAEPVTLNNKKHNRTHSEDVSLVHVISGYHGRFPSFVIMLLDRVWHLLWSPVKSLRRFCMSALGLVLFKHRPNKNYTLFYAYCNT